MDSLRYWVTEMHVDGFRFDLAATLARQFHEVDKLSAFFDLIQQDPVISQVKLIAEPWDVGDGGYQVGNFPPLWTEWNGKYRDTVRDFWRGEPGTLGEFASRLTGSSDLYEHSGRKPIASINFVTAHDGFTLRDLVSYNEKHNEANGEDGRDGESHNRSWNCGVEGPTDDPEVSALRLRQQRNFLTTLLLSQGVPMIAHGDEIGRTQQGNNNVYCQDNELAWVDWDLGEDAEAALRVHRRGRRRAAPRARRCSAAAASSPAAPTTAASPSSATSPGSSPRVSRWASRRWTDGEAKTVMVFLNGQAIPTPDSRGRRVARRRLPRHLQRRPRGGRLHPARRGVGRALGRRDRHRRRRRRHRAGTRPAASSRCSRARVVVLRSPRETPPQPSGAATTHRT